MERMIMEDIIAGSVLVFLMVVVGGFAIWYDRTHYRPIADPAFRLQQRQRQQRKRRK
jgi:hypothetical protein